MERAISSALDLWQRFTFTRYLAASIVSLAFDMAIFSSLLALRFEASLASAIGYCAGIVIHWIVSAQFVFTGKARAGNALHVQRMLFAGSALLGLAITVVTVSQLSNAGVQVLVAKGVAVVLSFVIVYAARKWGVFA
jgi:putative flippase GtrA